jgi:hypothetical protein
VRNRPFRREDQLDLFADATEQATWRNARYPVERVSPPRSRPREAKLADQLPTQRALINGCFALW